MSNTTTKSAAHNTSPQHLVEPSAAPRAHREIKRQRIEIDPARLEELTAAHGRNQKAIARELGIGASTLSLKLSQSSMLRAAYERGMERAGVPVRPHVQPHEEHAPAASVEKLSPVVPAAEAPEEEAAPAPSRSSLIGSASDEDLVLDAIKHRQRIVGDILLFTGLTNARVRRAVDVLEHSFQIKMRYERNLQHFYLSSEDWAR